MGRVAVAKRWLSPTQAAFLLNTRHATGGVSGDQVRRQAALGAIPAELSGRHLRLDEERLPEIAATIRRILPAAAVSPAAAPTARRPRRLPRSRPAA
jgi:hypothetical protein